MPRSSMSSWIKETPDKMRWGPVWLGSDNNTPESGIVCEKSVRLLSCPGLLVPVRGQDDDDAINLAPSDTIYLQLDRTSATLTSASSSPAPLSMPDCARNACHEKPNHGL
jgi:hypothetical protein